MVSGHQGVLAEENFTKFDKKVEQYKSTNGALMPILNEAQKIFGCIPLEVQIKISESINVPLAEVYGVITFYSHFSLEPRGEYVIGLCIDRPVFGTCSGKIKLAKKNAAQHEPRGVCERYRQKILDR